MTVMLRNGARVVAACVAVAVLAILAAPAGSLTDANRWADTFCTETGTWLTGAQQGADELSAKADDASLTPAGARKLIADYLATGVDATKSFGQEVKRAGVPDVKNGPKIQAAILAGIAGAQAKLTALQKTAKAMPTKPLVAFQKATTKLGNELGKFADPFTKGVSKAKALDTSGELGTAINTLPSCAALDQASSGG
jgi:hypothetical protein